MISGLAILANLNYFYYTKKLLSYKNNLKNYEKKNWLKISPQAGYKNKSLFDATVGIIHQAA